MNAFIGSPFQGLHEVGNRAWPLSMPAVPRLPIRCWQDGRRGSYGGVGSACPRANLRVSVAERAFWRPPPTCLVVLRSSRAVTLIVVAPDDSHCHRRRRLGGDVRLIVIVVGVWAVTSDSLSSS